MRIKTYGEFWQFYLKEHSQPLNRKLHFTGTSLGLIFLAFAAILEIGWLVLGGLFSGYAFAWGGHLFSEKNTAATFKYPIWSFISDFRMWFLILTRQPLK